MASVAAVVPCFNGERYLAEALESIRTQTRPADEVIVVDDGSTDESVGIAESFGAMVIRQRNMGEGAARNAGIEAASTDFIAWLDADDRWRPQHLQVVAGLLERTPTAVAAFGAVQRFGTRNERIFGYVPQDVASSCLEEAFADWLHTTIASVTRRSALLEIQGFDVTEQYAVDFDLWLRLARDHRFIATHEVTSEWRWHSAQQSARSDQQRAAVYRYRQRFLETLRRDGEPTVARVLEQRLARAWVRDVKASIVENDAASLRWLRDVAPTIPMLTPKERVTWSLAARTPQPVLRRVSRRLISRGAARR